MPNAINPNDYNIDYFSSGFLGITTAGDFREYLLGNNLQDLPPELITGAAGNFTDDFSERGVEKDINYAPITNPGSIDEWNLAGNFEVSLFDISYQNPSQNVGTNQYGPPTIQPYNEPSLVPEETGFIQYPTSTGGDDFKSILKENLLSDQLNLGPGSAVNFPSPLNDIAKEQRKEEAKNKLKLKAENQILGKLNLDPFGLLAGQDLILKDYDITTRPTVGGKILDFVTDAVGLEIPTSPIPDGAFGKWGDNDGPETYLNLMKSTGAGTKSLIFNSVSKNKYGPILQEPSGKLANTFGAGQAPQPKKYTDNLDSEYESNLLTQKEKPLVDRINQRIGKIVDNIAGQAGIGIPAEDLSPKEFENPSVTTDNVVKNSEFGFDELPNNSMDTWDLVGPRATTTKTITTVIPGEFGEILDTNAPLGSEGSLTFGQITPDTIIEKTVYEQDKGTIGTGAPFGQQTDLGFFSLKQEMFWASTPDGSTNPFKRGILKYTQDLINQSKEQEGSKARFVGVVNDDSNFDQNTRKHKNYSMGNTVSSEGTYCRSWSVRNPYSKVSDLIRHGAGDGTGGYNALTRPDFNLSVLGDNGFVKITPYTTDENGFTELKVGNPSVQKYMLSIENLAWQNTDHILKVPPCEVGPNGGRIMWFPPYDISFTDNSSVNWDSTQVIGRGEPIYTYNSTERTGTLAFKIVVDHSMAMAELRKDKNKTQEALFRYFAGCEDPIEAAIPVVPITEIEEIKIDAVIKKEVIPKKEVPNPPSPPGPVTFYFRNAYRFEKDKYGVFLDRELAPNAFERAPNYPKNWYRENPNGYLRGTIPTDVNSTGYTQQINDTRNEQAILALDEMVNFLLSPDGKRFRIKIVGRTSDAGVNPRNKKLGQKRAETTYNYMLNRLLSKEIEIGRIPAYQLGSQKDFPSELTWKRDPLRWNITTTGEEGSSLSQQINATTGQVEFFRDEDPTDNLVPDVTVPEAIADRNTTISLEYNKEIDDLFTIDNQEQIIETIDTPASSSRIIKEREATQTEAIAQRLAERASRYMAWECSYFEKMKQDTPFIYDNLKEKLKYFHPAFHSMTPEGFNSRLTFLKQCTRQGPNIAEGEPSNLAFGKPPICVLRVGDFYHTKIVIDSVNLTFDPIQWDLNPEGIGVQPMLCSVDLNFKFIGGSSLGGPISQLQNAVGFNFFANTGLYNPRTIYSSTQDYNKEKPDASTGLDSENPDGTVNNTQTTKSFGFGAYIQPGQVIKDGNFVDETEALPPPAGDPIENTKQKQIEDEGIVEQKTDEFTQEEKDAIEEQFNKKADDRAGVFKIKFQANVNSTLTGKGIVTSVDLGQALYNGEDRGEIKPLTISIVSSQESLEEFEVTYPNGTVKEYSTSDFFTSSHPTGIVSKTSSRKWVTLWDPVDRKNSLLGQAYNGVSYSEAIEPGDYKFRGITTIESTLEEEGTSELSKKIYSTPKTLKVLVCTNAADGNVVFLSEIPEEGLC